MKRKFDYFFLEKKLVQFKIEKSSLIPLFLFCIACIFFTQSYAQVSAYAFTQLSGTYTPLGSGGTRQTSGEGDDASTSAISIGFNFTYNNTVRSSLFVSSNGFIVFDPTYTNTQNASANAFVSASNNNGQILSTATAGANNLIAALNFDLRYISSFTITGNSNTSTSLTSCSGANFTAAKVRAGMAISGTGIPTGTYITGVNTSGNTITLSAPTTSTSSSITLTIASGLVTATTGVSPNRIFTVQWSGRKRFSVADDIDFQAKLYETTNIVELIYNAITIATVGSAGTNDLAQIGLKGNSNADYNNRSTSTNWSSTIAGTINTATLTLSNTIKPASGQLYRWTPSSCNPPSALNVTSVAVTSATLNWTASISAPTSGYQWEVRTSGAAGSGATGLVTSGTVGAGIVTAPSGTLIANTVYTFYVRANCGSSNYSVWSTSSSFTTPCTASPITYTQGFNASTIPACWSTAIVGGTQTGTKISFVTTASNQTATFTEGTNFVQYNAFSSTNGGSGSEERLISAPLVTTGTANVEVKFDWFESGSTTYTNTAEGVTIEWSTNGTTWNSTTQFPRYVSTVSTTGAWSTKTVLLPAGAGNQAILYVALKFHSEFGYNCYVDKFIVQAASPTFTATALNSFGNICTSTTAGPNSFTITGIALTSANVTVAAVTGYTYSTTAGGTYTSSLTFTQPGGAYTQTIFVKFNPTLVQSYNGNITVGGGGASNLSVAVTGSGVNSAPTVTSGTASSITINSATVAGTISAIGCSAITAYGIEWSITNGFANGAGTAIVSSNLSGSNFSASLTSLAPGTTYYFHAYAANAAGTSYGIQGSFTTPCAALNVPYSQNFDGVTLPTLPACISVQDINVDTYTWKTCDKNSLGNGTDITPYSGSNHIGISYNFDDATVAMNDWFYLPGLNFTGGTSYRLTFYTRGYTYSGDDERMEVKYGTSATAASMTSGTIMTSTLIIGGVGYTQKTFDFTPASNGVYYIGFHGISAADLWYLFVDDISVTVTPPCNTGGTAAAANASICGTSGATSITAINYSISGAGLAYQWQSSTDNFASNIVNIAGATTPSSVNTGTIATTTYYRLRVYCISLGFGYSNIVTVVVTNPLILTTTPATRCGIGTANVQATASSGSVIKWYTAASGGAAIGTGSPFVTPAISATTTYYVAAAAAGASTATVGPASPTAQSGTIGTQISNWRVYFDVSLATTLQSVDVFPVTAGQSATLYIFNAGGTQLLSVPYTTSVSGGTTAQTIPINISLNIGTGYSIYASGIPTSGLKRNESGAVYPYTSSSINITGNGYDNTYFMCYYNWKFTTGCEGTRTAVTATVTPPPALALTSSAASICSGNSTIATVTAATIANFTSYSWLPNVGVVPSGTPSGSSATLSPIVTTTYVLSGSTIGGCVNQASIVITVNPAPPVTVGAAVCSGNNATISASSACANFTNAGTAIPGSWNAATDPVAIQPVIFLPNSTTCEFDATGNTMNYTTTTFQVSVSGTYTFAMDASTSYDGMGYIVTGAFVPGTCPGSGTWVVGDDDSGPSSLEPLMTANLSTGITYTLISTCYYPGSSTVTGAYNWTITPPTGGQITTVSNGSLQWYTVATGGSAIASGTTFNPVGIAGSGVANNTAVGNYIFYAACTNNTGCRTATGYSIGATGQWTGASNTIWANTLNWCGGVPSISTNVTIANGAPNMPVLGTGTGTVNNLTVLTGATLTITNATMQIAGAITAAASTITASAGTIELKGTTTQSIAGSAFVNRNLFNLIASNSVTVSAIANDTLRIIGALSFGNVNSKTLNASDNITLVSNATGTARVADITNNGANTGNVVSGKFVVERYIPARRAWRLITAPIATNAQTIKQAWQEGVGGTWSSNPAPGFGTHITGGTLRTTAQGYDQGPNNPSLFAYNGTAWNILPATTNDALSNYQGYMLFVRGSRALNLPASTPSTVPDNTVLRPTGAINTGTRPTVTSIGGGFTVVANPYASAINFNNVNKSGVIGGTGGNNAYYLWDPNLGGNFGYGSFIAFSWNGVDYDKNIGPSNIDSAGIISSGAAFMVNLNPGGSITFDENDKVADGTGSTYLFRPVSHTSKLRTTLFAHNADGSKALNDGVLVTFNPHSSNDVNDEEAFKINNFAENFCVLHQGKNIAIERRKNIGINDTLFFNMWNMKVKKYELQFDITSFDLPANTTMYLEDTYLKQETPITIPINIVPFEVTTDSKSATANRFRLIFKNKKTQNIAPVKYISSITISPNPIQNNIIHLVPTNLPIGNYNIKIVQADGKVIERQIWLNDGSNSQIIMQQQLAPANYFLEISNNKIKKIAIPFMVE